MPLRHIVCAALLAFLVTGCAATAGAPRRGWSITDRGLREAGARDSADRALSMLVLEAVIPGTSKKQLVDVLAERMIRQGYSVGRIDDYHAQFDGPAGFWDLLAGYDTFRVTFTLLDTPAGLWVGAEMANVRKPGRACEETLHVRGGKSAGEIHRTLEAVKRTIVEGVKSEP